MYDLLVKPGVKGFIDLEGNICTINSVHYMALYFFHSRKRVMRASITVYFLLGWLPENFP